MKIGTVLLSKDGYYIGNKGELPPGRPQGDKAFISNLIKDKVVLCSANTYTDLPLSMKNSAMFIKEGNNWDINFGIGTFKQQCDLFIIVRTDEEMYNGKLFKREYIEDMYNKIMDLNGIELYIKK